MRTCTCTCFPFPLCYCSSTTHLGSLGEQLCVIQIWISLLAFVCKPPGWVDEVWDLEFTEKKALEDVAMEEEWEEEQQPAGAAHDKAFQALYQCLLVHATDQRQSTGGDKASMVRTRAHFVQFAKSSCNVRFESDSFIRACGRRWARTRCPSNPWWLFSPPSSCREKKKQPVSSRE